jgi:MoaA/NifB/PqqE/SkfB family radical SAM enzyme
MKNPYINLKRLEFMVTFRCTAKCEHCSAYADGMDTAIKHMDLNITKQAITDAYKVYKIEKIVTFGGEPLLFSEFALAIHKHSAELGIEKRELVTSGCFSNNLEKIQEVTHRIKEAEVNCLLVSIDCFHEKYLDYNVVKQFLLEVKNVGIKNVSLHPAWVVNEKHDNKYNKRTKELLKYFANLGFKLGKGDNIYPSGKAIENLKEYLPKPQKNISGTCTDYSTEHRHRNAPNNVEVFTINPHGDVGACDVIGNLYKNSMIEIITDYDYQKDKVFSAVVKSGSQGIYNTAKEYNISLKEEGYYSLCKLCRDVRKKLSESIS